MKKWDNAKLIQIELRYNPMYIRACCRKHQKTAFGYIWKYADDELQKTNYSDTIKLQLQECSN